MVKSQFGQIWTKLDANLDYSDMVQTIGMTRFLNKVYNFGKKVEKFCEEVRENFFCEIENLMSKVPQTLI